MHTIMVLAGGFALLAVVFLGGRLLGVAPATAARAFAALWFVAAAVNMWVGVTRAGYSVAVEAPIFLVVFGIPAALAAFLGWKLPPR